MPVIKSDKERKLVRVDTTSILGVRRFSTWPLRRWRSNHPHSTIYLFIERRDEGGEREDESDDLAPKQYIEQGFVVHLAGTDVANGGERVSEEENEESRADNEDSVDLHEVFDQWWADERSIHEGGVFRLEIFDGYPRVVFVEIVDENGGSNFDQEVWSGWSGQRGGGGCRDSINCYPRIRGGYRDRPHGRSFGGMKRQGTM